MQSRLRIEITVSATLCIALLYGVHPGWTADAPEDKIQAKPRTNLMRLQTLISQFENQGEKFQKAASAPYTSENRKCLSVETERMKRLAMKIRAVVTPCAKKAASEPECDLIIKTMRSLKPSISFYYILFSGDDTFRRTRGAKIAPVFSEKQTTDFLRNKNNRLDGVDMPGPIGVPSPEEQR